MRKKYNANWEEIVKNRKPRHDAVYLEMNGIKKTVSQWCDFLKLTYKKNKKQKDMIKNSCRNKYQQSVNFGWQENYFLYHADKNLPQFKNGAET